MSIHAKEYLVTDGCMWEINKKMGDEHPHAIEVVDLETGAVRYIRSGSRIAFLGGDITDIRTQSDYNKATKAQKAKKMPTDGESNVHTRAGRTSKEKTRTWAARALPKNLLLRILLHMALDPQEKEEMSVLMFKSRVGERSPRLPHKE